MRTYKRLTKPKAVGLVKDRVVIIIQGSFSLQREFMERVEAFKSERCLGPIERCGKPASAKELCALV